MSAFYIPALGAATQYDRAVAYFTSDGLALAAEGLDRFAARDGQMRLVVSPELVESDLDAIRRGYEARQNIVERRLLDALNAAENLESTTRLAWLVAAGRLDVRVAVPRRGLRLYHEKIGVLADADGCRVAFTGSVNETVGGLVANFESIDVFFSWDATADRVQRKSDNFSRLWENRTADLDILELPDAVRIRLIELGQRARFDVTSSARPRRIERPPQLEPRAYQQKAVDAWFASGGRGILEMATGSGKTKTALLAAERVGRSAGGVTLIITAPFIHLIDQWANECEEWGIRAIRCYEGSAKWHKSALEAADRRKADVDRVTCLVTTNATATTEPFQAVLRNLSGPTSMLIADEVHNLGASVTSSVLMPMFGYRMGLSATPERWNDPEGTALLMDYFGGVVFRFGIRDAIAADVLVPYDYEPVLVTLVESELAEYMIIVEKLERAERERLASPEFARLLSRRRAILDEAVGKIDAVRSQLRLTKPEWTLFYCAGRTQLDAVSEVLRDLGATPRVFTAEESRDTRQRLIQRFVDGDVDALLAIKVLDEGIDVPAIRAAHILASTQNPREFVQRRGRVLRKAPGKTEAKIVDYVTIPAGRGQFERSLVRREMTRVLDFAASARNAPAARERVWQILDRYDLIHLMGEHM